MQMLKEFRALLQHSPVPLPCNRFLQLLALNMFAIESTQLKGNFYSGTTALNKLSRRNLPLSSSSMLRRVRAAMRHRFIPYENLFIVEEDYRRLINQFVRFAFFWGPLRPSCLASALYLEVLMLSAYFLFSRRMVLFLRVIMSWLLGVIKLGDGRSERERCCALFVKLD